RINLRVLEDHAEVLSRRCPPEGCGKSTAAAGDGLIATVADDLLDLLLGDPVFGDVLDVALGVIFHIPDEANLRHARAPSFSTRIAVAFYYNEEPPSRYVWLHTLRPL